MIAAVAAAYQFKVRAGDALHNAEGRGTVTGVECITLPVRHLHGRFALAYRVTREAFGDLRHGGIRAPFRILADYLGSLGHFLSRHIRHLIHNIVIFRGGGGCRWTSERENEWSDWPTCSCSGMCLYVHA